jgi:hypothetical protein
MRPQTGRAVVLAARSKRRLMERIDRGPVLGQDRHVQRAIERTFFANPKIGLAARAEAGGISSCVLIRADFHDQGVAERCQRARIERLRTLVV